MARQRIVPVYAVNIAADPHPEAVYRRILARASEIIVHARGNDYARITKPIENPTNENILSGRLHIWTDIDMEGDWIDLQKQEKLSREDREQIQIPDHARPNFRIFEYAFSVSRHTMYLEAKNDLDKTVGPSTILGILVRVFTRDALGEDFPEVSVTMIPADGVAKELLSVPRIRTIHIRAYRPNPDFASPEAAQRVYARMDRMNVHAIEEKLSRNADAETIELSGESKDLAEVAVDTGELRVQGRDEDNRRVDLSSRDRPRRYDVPMDKNDSFLARLLEKIPGLL